MIGLGGGVVWNKPKNSIVCYCCGREFFRESIKIHLPQCEALWIKREALKPPKERRPLPRSPGSGSSDLDFKDSNSIQQWNESAYENYYEKGRVECPHCGRKFAPDVAERHIPRCVNIVNKPKPPPSLRPATAAIQTSNTIIPSFSSVSSLSSDPSISSSSLVNCSYCNRHFAPERIEIHERACQKHSTQQEKRNIKLNEKRPKTSGSREENQRESTSNSSSAGKDNSNTWKSQHSEFIQAIRYGKQIAKLQKSGVNLASLPPPPPSSNPDYVTCPSCNRRFAPDVAERHIPKCANIINKPKPPPRAAPQSSLSPSSLPSIHSAVKSPRTGRSVTFSTSPQAQAKAALTVQPRSPELTRPTSTARSRNLKSPSVPVTNSVDSSQADLHDKISQLQATVAALTAHVQQIAVSPSSPPGLNRICASCGEKNLESARFCGSCGQKCK
jgi:hypothetical protein